MVIQRGFSLVAHEKDPLPEERQAGMQSFGQRCLAAQAKARNQLLIGGLVTSLDIIKQVPALTDHRQKAAARAEILFVRLQMLGQINDTLGQNRNLHRS